MTQSERPAACADAVAGVRPSHDAQPRPRAQAMGIQSRRQAVPDLRRTDSLAQDRARCEADLLVFDVPVVQRRHQRRQLRVHARWHHRQPLRGEPALRQHRRVQRRGRLPAGRDHGAVRRAVVLGQPRLRDGRRVHDERRRVVLRSDGRDRRRDGLRSGIRLVAMRRDRGSRADGRCGGGPDHVPDRHDDDARRRNAAADRMRRKLSCLFCQTPNAAQPEPPQGVRASLGL